MCAQNQNIFWVKICAAKQHEKVFLHTQELGAYSAPRPYVKMYERAPKAQKCSSLLILGALFAPSTWYIWRAYVDEVPQFVHGTTGFDTSSTIRRVSWYCITEHRLQIDLCFIMVSFYWKITCIINFNFLIKKAMMNREAKAMLASWLQNLSSEYGQS